MLCLSFDTDHMDDSRMAEFLSRVTFPGQGTFFCTQVYESLSDSRHELAPHPFLPEGGDWQKELARMRTLFPRARGWRSHSCVFSHLLAEWLGRNDYLYASTNDQYNDTGITPVRQPWGLWHMPIYYMDNMDFSTGRFWPESDHEPFSEEVIEKALNQPGLYIFDFHPIHLMLNTPDFEFYAAARDRFKAGEAIENLRFEGTGTLTFFQKLTTAMQQAERRSQTLTEALETYIG